MLPFGFLLAGLALMVPFTPKLASLALPGPWSVARSMAVVLPVLVGLVLVLDAFRGAFEARVGAGLPALAGGLVAAPALATTAIPVVLPEPLLPTPAQALAAGGTVCLALLHADDVVAWMVGRPREALLGQPARAALGLDLADEGALDEGTHAARLRGPDGGARRVRVSDITPEHLRERARWDRVRARFATRLVTREVPNRLAAPAMHAEALADLLGPGGRSDDGAAHVAPDELARRLAGSLDGLERTLERVGPLDEPVPPDPGPIDLREALRAAVEALPPALRDELELRWELPEAATAPVRADDRIATVIEELLRNAHAHAGPEATVTVALDREGEGWTVSVADDGPGVPDGLKERVFEGFTRGAAGPAPGVGLALARVLVNAYGGRLWVEDRVPDRPEAGARFVVRLPAAEDPDAAPTDGETIHVAEAHRGPDPGG